MKKLYCLFAAMFAGLSLSYAQTAPELYPEPGEVESLETIEIDFGLSTVSIVEYSPEESFWYEPIVEGPDGTMGGTLSISKANPSLVLWNAYEKITTPGDVVFTIPEGCLEVNGVKNPEYTYNYTITGTSGGDDVDLVFGGYTADPASGSTVSQISTISLKYDKAWAQVDIQDGKRIQVLNANGAAVDGVYASFEAVWTPNFTLDSNKITLDPTITTPGQYTIVLPLYGSNDWGATRAEETIELTYTIEGEQAETPIYTALGCVTETEGWQGGTLPYIRDVQVEGYDGYVIFKGYAGVEGYDLKVWIGPSNGKDPVGGIAIIVDGVESEKYPDGYGYVNLPTGRQDYEYLRFYIGGGYGYGASEESGSGYFINGCYVGNEWGYYFIEWPQGDVPAEWENPFDVEATFMYSAVGTTCSFEGWGESILPVISDINVDVYDTYIYIHGLLGVEGYDAKVAYDANQNVLSMMSVIDGVDGKACKSYLYLSTGVDEFPTIQAYNNYSYAWSDQEGSGYVCLAAYIYDETGTYEWNYYGLAWDNTTGVSNVTVESSADDAMYNVMGQRVKDDYRGIVIVKGKKMLKK